MIRLSLFWIVFLFAYKSNSFKDSSSFLPPSIQLTILVHPYNKALYLPFTLGSIEYQHYPKDRLRIHFITERLFFEESFDYDSGIHYDHFDSDRSLILDERLRQNDLTIEILKRWTRENREVFNEIELSISNIKLIDTIDDIYWTKDRFTFIINTKNQELYNAARSWVDYLIFIDADVILTNRFMLKNLTSLERIEDLVIVSPMLRSFGTYSNFWAGMNEKGYYERTDEYLPILERKEKGTFSVPMVHSCFLINLNKKSSRFLTFDPNEVYFQQKSSSNELPSVVPFDDIIAFAKSAAHNNIKLYINNVHEWGMIPSPLTKETSDDSKLLLTEFHLESLVEGLSFPVSPSLDSYIDPPEVVDSLGVDKIYVINLLRRADRKKRMIKSLNLLGIKAVFWNATDGKSLTKSFLEKFDIKMLNGYVDPYHKRPITFGEIGCFMSHYRIWEDAYRNNFSKIIILEDDVRFDRNFRKQWSEALDRFIELSEYDFLYLGRKLNENHKDEIIVDDLFVRPGYSYWTIGYMVTFDGIRKLLHSNPLSRMIPVDEYLPIMYGSHVNETLSKLYNQIELLNALSLRHLVVSPTHYVGDDQYISDTEDSDKVSLITEKNSMPNEDSLEQVTVINNSEQSSNLGKLYENDVAIQPPPSNYILKQHLEL